MKRGVSRWRLMQATSSAVAAGVLSPASRLSAASPGELRLNLPAGNFGDAVMNAFVEPFAVETGIDVTPL